MKTFVATTGDIDSLGRDLRVEADRRGVGRAKTVVALSDNGHGIPSMLERYFQDIDFNRVTDFYHSAAGLADGLGLGGVGLRPDRRAGEARADARRSGPRESGPSVPAMDPRGRERAPHDQGGDDVGGRPLGTPVARPDPDPRNRRDRPRS